MGSLSRKIKRANIVQERKYPGLKRDHAKSTAPIVTDEGIFCDCFGTLYSYNYDCHELLVDYLNAQHAAGRKVTLVSSNIMQVRKKISDIGLHEDIVASLTKKEYYYNTRVMEVLIDDDPVLLRAATLYHPQNAGFRKHMEDFLAKNPAPAALVPTP